MEVLGTILMIVRRDRVSTSVGKQVTSRLSANRMSLVTILEGQVISVPSVPNRRRWRVRCSL